MFKYYASSFRGGLKILGMFLNYSVIVSDRAELSRIATGSKTLSVTNILQKVMMKVDTEGTEAAVATIAQITTYMAGNLVTRIVDRPFLFMLWDKKNSIPLIVGALTDPSLSS